MNRSMVFGGAFAVALLGAGALYWTGYLTPSTAAEAGKPAPAAAEATKAAAPAAPPAAAPASRPPAVLLGCAEEPRQDGCFMSNAIRVGEFLCRTGESPVAVEFLNTPVRAKLGIIGRGVIPPSTAVMMINEGTPTPIDLSTATNATAIDVVTVKASGEMTIVGQNVAPSKTPLHMDAAKAMMILGGGELKRLGVDKTCGFALGLNGIPPISAKKPLDPGLNMEKQP